MDEILTKHNLSMSILRGQGCDGNMHGELNGLKNLILDANPYAFMWIFCPPSSIGGSWCY